MNIIFVTFVKLMYSFTFSIAKILKMLHFKFNWYLDINIWILYVNLATKCWWNRMFRPNYFIEWVITPFFKEHILIKHEKFMFFNFPKKVTLLRGQKLDFKTLRSINSLDWSQLFVSSMLVTLSVWVVCWLTFFILIIRQFLKDQN